MSFQIQSIAKVELFYKIDQLGFRAKCLESSDVINVACWAHTKIYISIALTRE
jgi:hypothetical protein